MTNRWDGFDGRKGVVILAATNRPESLDRALLRPGRFDRRIQMELPDLEGRKAILEVHLAKVKHDEVDLSIVAQATAGSSGPNWPISSTRRRCGPCGRGAAR